MVPARRNPVSHPLPRSGLPPAWLAAMPSLRRLLLAWWRRAGRHDLPWITTDPYGILVSEIMLQQTTVAAVRARYPAWMARWPTVASLAAATEEDVSAVWEGLGYAARARRLHAAARHIAGTGWPQTRQERLALPGVGPSTASALAALAQGRREAIFDANVARIWSRWTGEGVGTATQRARLWSLAQHAMPRAPRAVRQWTQAQMDLGATVCTARNPNCQACPWRVSCASRDAVVVPRCQPTRATHHTVLVMAWDANSAGPKLERRPEGVWWGGSWTPPAVPRDRWPASVEAAARRWETGAGAWAPEGTLGYGVAPISGRRIAWAVLDTAAPNTVERCPWNRMEHRAWPATLRRWHRGLDQTDASPP